MLVVVQVKDEVGVNGDCRNGLSRVCGPSRFSILSRVW